MIIFVRTEKESTNTMSIIFTKERISSTEQAGFKHFWHLYELSFPEIERKDKKGIACALSKKQFHNELFYVENKPAALLAYWLYPEFCYLEYIAVNPSLKGQGAGSQILQELLDKINLPIILEIEHVVDETTRRRQNFYERLQFIANPQHDHQQPPYQKGFNPLPMLLMTYPKVVSAEAYKKFHQLLITEIVEI